MLLCDFAQVADGKLYVIGGGWSIAGPGPTQMAVALKFDVPWDRTNHPITIQLRLTGEDGEPVMQPGPMGEQPVQIEGEFEVGRPPGLKPGTPIDVPLAINLGMLTLPPGQRYSWELTVDKETRDDWHLSFMTRPAAPVPGEAPKAAGG
jgi:hypothetical protein